MVNNSIYFAGLLPGWNGIIQVEYWELQVTHGKSLEHVNKGVKGFGVPGQSFTQWLNPHQGISSKSLFSQFLNTSEKEEPTSS